MRHVSNITYPGGGRGVAHDFGEEQKLSRTLEAIAAG
jgi:hypothetical protein